MQIFRQEVRWSVIITPAILNLETVYAVREQLHGQAAFFLEEIVQICIGRAL